MLLRAGFRSRHPRHDAEAQKQEPGKTAHVCGESALVRDQEHAQTQATSAHFHRSFLRPVIAIRSIGMALALVSASRTTAATTNTPINDMIQDLRLAPRNHDKQYVRHWRVERLGRLAPRRPRGHVRQRRPRVRGRGPVHPFRPAGRGRGRRAGRCRCRGRHNRAGSAEPVSRRAADRDEQRDRGLRARAAGRGRDDTLPLLHALLSQLHGRRSSSTPSRPTQQPQQGSLGWSAGFYRPHHIFVASSTPSRRPGALCRAAITPRRRRGPADCRQPPQPGAVCRR